MTDNKADLKKFVALKAFGLAAFIVGFAIGGVLIWNCYNPPVETSYNEIVERETVYDSPIAVYSEHKDECWTMREAPKAELPGAAIVQFNDGHTVYTKKHSLVSEAFDEALTLAGFSDKMSDRINVIALCI